MKRLVIFLLCGYFCHGTGHAQSGDAGNLTWEIVNKTLIIEGEGVMTDYSAYYTANAAPWHIYRSDIEKIVICEGVTHIGDKAFDYDYDCLISITIAASVESFGDDAFLGCDKVTEFISTALHPQNAFPSTFADMSSICTLRVPESSINSYKSAIGWNYFNHVTPIFATISFSKDEVFYVLEGSTESLINHLTVMGISPMVVAWKSSDTDVATVDHAGDITIVDAGTAVITGYIGAIEASYTITAFAEGGVEGTLTWGIHNEVLIFRGNGAIPDDDDDSAPWKNLVFKSIDIGEGVTSIGQYAFFGCIHFVSASIPSTVININRTAFGACYSMTSITVDANNPAYSSENDVLLSKDKTMLVIFPSGRTESYTIPESIKTLGDYAFYTSRLTSVFIPNSITSISSGAFYSCFNLATVVIPNSVTSIEYAAFYYCQKLTSIVLPSSLTFIESGAFYNCLQLSEIVNLNPTPLTISSGVFTNVDFETCLLRVYDVAAYKNEAVWMEFKNIEALDIEINIDKNDIYMLAGATATLTATVNADLEFAEIIWKSNSHEVAIVNNGGEITALNPGPAVITASIFESSAACMVTVILPGKSTIEGTVSNAGIENIIVKLYMKPTEDEILKSSKVVGGYVLLASTIPNEDGQYSFDDLPEGLYQVEIVIDDYEPETTGIITLPEDAVYADVNFIVDPVSGVIISDFPTGTVETWHAAFLPELKVYPNPFTDVLRITGNVETRCIATIQVINAAGTIVHTQMITLPDETIHLGHLPTGMYIIRLENGGKATFVKAIKN